MKSKFTFVTIPDNIYETTEKPMTRPIYKYLSGKGEGCTREEFYFGFYNSKEEALKDLEESDYFEKETDNLVLVEVFSKSYI